MAKKRWIVVPGGRIKRWKRSERERGCQWVRQVPPHWYRNYLNRRERRKVKAALFNNAEYGFPHIHPRIAAWYW